MTNGAFPREVREAVHARDQWCAGCGTSTGLTIQHRRARGMGGTTRDATATAANGLLLCGSGTTGCHGWTEDHPALAALLGWRVDQREDPATVPVWRAGPLGGDWSILADDGFAEAIPDRLDPGTLADVTALLRRTP